MKSKRSLRVFSNTLTAAGLALAVSACSTLYQDDWNQNTNVPDLNEPAQRSLALLDYCKKLHSRGDLNLAAGICNRAHEINPTDPVPLIALARVLEDLQMAASAEEAYRAALLLDPQQTDALYGLGKIYIDQQRYDMAMGPLEAAAQVQTDDPRIYNALGVIKDQQGQHADAQAYYQQGLAHSPRNISLRNNLGLSMVLDGQPEAGLAMLRDVAAEPAAGATAGRNLEMASQIAAQRILENPDESASALDTPDPRPQTVEIQQSPHGDGPWRSQELSTLSPSSSVDESEAPASEPLPLLQPYSRQHSDSIPATTPVSPAQNTAQNMQSLDHELADAMMQQPIDESETAALEATVSAPEPVPAPEATSPTVAAAERDDEMASQRQVKPAAPPQIAALPETASAAEPATGEEIGIPRDWSLAAQTVFATSRVSVPEPSQITSQERTAANDAFHATPGPEASSKMSSGPAMTVQAKPHGGLAIALASAPASAPQIAALPETASVAKLATDEATEIPRDWSLAAKTVFATSRVSIPEPSKITSQERTAANDAFHATPAPEASSKMSSGPAMTVQAKPHGDLALALASTPETSSEPAAASDSYPIDEDIFYTAQLASFLTAARARAGWQILRDSAGELLDQSDGYIVRADLGAELGTFYRVRTGMMDDRAAASQFCLGLQAEGLDCMPVEASIEETSETLVEKICQSGSTGVLCRTVQRSEAAPKGAPHVKG